MRRAPRRPVTRIRVEGEHVRADTRADVVAGEEPLEIRVNGEPFSVTMRTPGDDFDLAVGFLLGEGIVTAAPDIAGITYGPGVDAAGLATYNIVDVRLAAGIAPPGRDTARRVYTSSSCGICGTSSIEQVTKQSLHPVAHDTASIDLAALLALPDRLRAEQDLFRRTGGVHAAGLFVIGDGPEPELVKLAEDVGRHNAVDKVLGALLRDGRIPLQHSVLQVSGRASFELVQKASMAGVPVLAAVSAPSDLAVELATTVGMTLAGFSRGGSINLYSRPDRVTLPSDAG